MPFDLATTAGANCDVPNSCESKILMKHLGSRLLELFYVQRILFAFFSMNIISMIRNDSTIGKK